MTMTPEQIITRARMYINPAHNVTYRMGGGGMNPGEGYPWGTLGDLRLLDCSGFVCWVIGIRRQQPWGWLNTDSMEIDIRIWQKYFRRILQPEPGCVVVDGAGKATGHCAIVTVGGGSSEMRVVDCSNLRDSKGNPRHAITENAGTWFRRASNKTVFGVFR